MAWLILGARGQLGRSLAQALIERNIDFVAWNSEDLDIRSTGDCDLQIGELAPDVVINAAAWTDVDGAEANPQGAFAVNAIGAINLANISRKISAIFVQVSTDYVFSGNAEAPWREDALMEPLSVYGATKAAGEAGVLTTYAERSYISRTAWLYSAWGKNFARTMTRLALANEEEVSVVNDQFGQPTFAFDLANQIVDSIIAELPFGIYHATNSGQASWFDFAQEIFSHCKSSPTRVIPVDSAKFVRPAPRPKYSVLGHDAWNQAGPKQLHVPEMPNWRISLASAMPDIIYSIDRE